MLVRVHARCTYGDVFGSRGCECGRLLRASLERISREDAGVLVYLHHAGHAGGTHQRPKGCARSAIFKHYSGPDGQRFFQYESGIGAQILSDLGLRTVRLLTNHPRRVIGLEAFGIEITGQIPL